MTTSAPIRKVHDVPIVVIVPERKTRVLPAPDPERWQPIVPAVPVRQPVKEPARR